jgi:hypothetical protein
LTASIARCWSSVSRYGNDALRVQLQQLARQLLHGCPGARLEVLPCLPAELREVGCGRVGPDVPRQLPDLLVRHEQPVLAAEREMEVVARHAGDRLRVEPEELPDAVVLVDDVVAHPQVGEARESAAEPGVRPGRLLAEDLGVRQEDEAELPPDEPAPRRRHREPELGIRGKRLARCERRAVDLSQECALPLGLAAVGERDDDAVPGADEPLELVLGLGDPACGDGWALRLEAMRLPLWERVELGRVVQLDDESLFVADAAHVVRLPDQVGRAIDGRDEICRCLGRPGSCLLGAEVRLDEVGPPLGCGIDRRLVGGVERTLGERRERANLLDLVAEEVDAKRLATRRREHVDEAAADGELPALVHAIHALVARERELLREPVDARLVADPELERGRSGPERRQAVRKRASRCAD